MSSADLVQSGEYVKLNVGGSLFYTTIGTLKNDPESMLSSMFSGRMELKTDSEGWVLIDRSGKYFNLILNFLRDGTIPLPDKKLELNELLVEAKFYCLDSLCKCIVAQLGRLTAAESELSSIKSNIIIVKDNKMSMSLISTTLKPVVKLTMNRFNNVFSYTSNSHDNLLRNVECLEKYALLFADTVTFVKDVSEKFENNQICEWSFHYRGYKLRSIDCMAIHYSTEKRLIKVEFHESRIHEEMLTLISVAARNLSDNDLSDIAKRQSGAHNRSLSITTAQISTEREDSEAETNNKKRNSQYPKNTPIGNISENLCDKKSDCVIVSLFGKLSDEILMSCTLNLSRQITLKRLRSKSVKPRNCSTIRMTPLSYVNFSGFAALNNAN